MENQNKQQRWLAWTAAWSDVVIVIFMCVWCAIAINQFEYWEEECARRYEYYEAQDDDPCVSMPACGDDFNCRLWSKYLFASSDYGSCSGEDCGGGGCYCVAAGPWKGLYLAYVISFSVSMLMEVFKALIVISAAMSESCDPATHGPLETSSIPYAMDSWTMILLRVIYEKRYKQLMEANEEGKIPVITKFKVGQWLYRDFACGLVITLYPFKIHYFNPCHVPYVLAVVSYVFCLWQRSLWVDSKKSTLVRNQPVLIPMVQQVQQPIQSSNVTASTTTEGY